MELKKLKNVLEEESYQDATVSGVHNVRTGQKTVAERWEFYTNDKNQLMVNVDGNKIPFASWCKTQNDAIFRQIVDQISKKSGDQFKGNVSDIKDLAIFVAKSLRKNVEPWDFKKNNDGTVVLNSLNEI